MKTYIPPFKITDKITNQIYLIAEEVSKIKYVNDLSKFPKLKKTNRIKTVSSSTAIENNSLSVKQVTDIVNGKHIKGPLKDIQEVKNCFTAYECLEYINPYSVKDLIKTHSIMVRGLCDQVGMLRHGNVGVYCGNMPIHIAPPWQRVELLINDLFKWVKTTKTNFLIASCVFHFEFEFIHPFMDGNGRMGRLWQTALLTQHHPVFKYLPIEEAIWNHRQEYYDALQICQNKSDSTLFIEFMLNMILNSIRKMKSDIQKYIDESSDQISDLLKVIDVEPKSSKEIMKMLRLKNQPNFYYNYLKPALEANLIKMSIPNKPKSKNQKYYKSR